MALHLVTSPGRLLLKGALTCFTLRFFCETDYLVGCWGEERAAILLCSAAASSLLHNTRLPSG